MGYKYDSFLNKGREQDFGDQNNKGYFATEDALTAAYPVGQNGWYAIVGTTDTIWVWDGDTSAWVNTHNASVQSDWDQTDETAPDFIKNKPQIPEGASDISITDAGSYYTGTDVEAALQEIGATLDGLENALEDI